MRKIEKQLLWYNSDLIKVAGVAAVVGFLVGVLVGYEWAWRPVVTTFKPLIG